MSKARQRNRRSLLSLRLSGFHAPEMWAEKPYSVQADIFSLGVSFMVLLFDMEGDSSLDKVRNRF